MTHHRGAPAPRWLLLETCANNGRYLGRRREYVPPSRAEPLWELLLPCSQVQCFGMISPLEISPSSETTATHVRLPLLGRCVKAIFRGHEPPELIRAGWCQPTASLRTVIPQDLGLDGWALKLHLPDAVRDRISTKMGSKEIAAHDAMIAPVFSHLLKEEQSCSDFLAVIEEPGALVATIGPDDARHSVGAILRRLPDANLIPGFAIYSRPSRPLPRGLPLGVEMIREGLPERSASAHNPLDVIDRCTQLFVEPLLDIFFALAARGITLQMHPQNILFEMSGRPCATQRVWVRDMGGVNYAPKFRAARGQDDLLAEAIAHVPGANEELLHHWFERAGERRRIFDERLMFGHAYDMHVSAFWFQLMVGLWHSHLLRLRELELLQRAIQRKAAAAAAHYDFDPDLLLPRFPAEQSMLAALWRGIAHRPPFRPHA